MSVVWLIGKIAVYTFILYALFRQTYNFSFVLTKRPTIWIAVAALLGVANMALAYAKGQAVRGQPGKTAYFL